MIDEHICAHEQSMAQELACAIAEALRQSLLDRGCATLAVSGGRSPLALFSKLSVIDLPWECITITLVDERCVAHDHVDSNAALVRRHLLVAAAAAARFIPLIDPGAFVHDDPALLRTMAEQRLATLPWPLDVVVLGLGTDGHTASLFADASGYAEAIDATQKQRICMLKPQAAAYARLSLSLNALRGARWRFMQFAGADKKSAYVRACHKSDPQWPASLLLATNPLQKPISVWTNA